MRISDWSSDVCSSDLTSEQKYKVVLRGLNDVFDDQFRDRFDQLSVLRGGEGDEANVAQISRRAEEDVELLQRLLRAKGYYSARVTSEILPGNAGARLQVVLDADQAAQYSVTTVRLPGLEQARETQK